MTNARTQDMAAVSRLRNRESQAERSRPTQRRIVEAACRLFVRDGYLQSTMADIAREAGVAVQTLYLSFGSKVAVLSAAIDVTIAGDDAPTAVIERDWHEKMRAEPDVRRALDAFVATATDVITRFYPLYAAVRAAAADPEPGHLLAEKKDERFRTFSVVARTFSVVAEELSEKRDIAKTCRPGGRPRSSTPNSPRRPTAYSSSSTAGRARNGRTGRHATSRPSCSWLPDPRPCSVFSRLRTESGPFGGLEPG